MVELFHKVPSAIDFPGDEKKVLSFWRERGIFAKSLDQTKGRPTFVFYEGPPTANGTPHNGHVLTRVIKDLFPRYKTMRGYHVPRKAGWDTHGLPVEVEVEKELGIHGKEAIEAYGVEDFTKRCIASVFRYTDVWEQLTERIGFWADLKEAYVTYHQSYVESVWWALAELYKKNLLYRGHKVVWWWPQGGTALSAGEVGLGYKTVDDPAITVRFAVKGEEKTSFLAWTTTPWTLPSNCALAVHSEVTYAYVQTQELSAGAGTEVVIVAEALVPTLFEKVEHQVLRTVKGSELVGTRYAPIFNYAAPEGGEAHFVIAADFVTTDSGTGIVHCAPAFGADDFAACKANNVGFINLIKPDGRFDARATDFAGRFCKEADRDIIRWLKREDVLVREEVYRHDYPFCWRADSDPLIQYARPAWFIRTTSVTPEAIANNKLISWHPEHIRDGRFGDWLKNNVDWALSRERYWGTPLNLWGCEHCGAVETPTSAADIERRNPSAFAHFEAAKAANPDLSPHLKVHKPWIDEVTFGCSCGHTMKRVPEVIDCWFDSGCMPFAQWGWPHKGHEEFAQAFPADFISEAVDQTRGWFYSLVMVSTLLFSEQNGVKREGPHPFKNCIVLGHVTDKHGKKESKSKGNYTPPDKILETDGADAMRWYFYAANPPWNNTRYSPEAVRLGQQEFLVKLRNVYSFFTIYANIDGFDPRTSPRREVSERSQLDRWILSELHLTLKGVTEAMDEFRLYDAAQKIIALTDGLSNWYVRRSRDRFWASADGPDAADKWDAFHTLYEVLVAMTKMAAPFTPFITETMWQNLVRNVDAEAPESVHLASWPELHSQLIDEALSEEMAAVRELVALGLQARNANRLKVRQPLSRVELILGQPALCDRLEPYAPLISDELNVKKVVFTQDAHNVSFTLKPNFRALGPIYGARVQLVKKALEKADAKAARAQLVQSGSFTLALEDGGTAELSSELIAVTVTPAEGWVASAGTVGVVILDSHLTEELVAEGRARELLSRLQAWRKDANLEYVARIRVGLEGDTSLLKAGQDFQAMLSEGCLATELCFGQALVEPEERRELEVDGLPLVLTFARA